MQETAEQKENKNRLNICVSLLFEVPVINNVKPYPISREALFFNEFVEMLFLLLRNALFKLLRYVVCSLDLYVSVATVYS